MTDPLDLLDAFLAAHAGGLAVPIDLYLRGQGLHDHLTNRPPGDPRWGRFLVALGTLAAEHLADNGAAEAHFRRALADLPYHGDGESAITAGYDLGVLRRRAGDAIGARQAWMAAARAGLRQGVLCANLLRAALAALDMALDDGHDPDPDTRALAKQTWLAWLWLRRQADDASIDSGLADGLRRTLAVLLLPEDPLTLAASWRTWMPALVPTPTGVWRDSDPSCLAELFSAAAEAASLRPATTPDISAYHHLAAAARRTMVPAP